MGDERENNNGQVSSLHYSKVVCGMCESKREVTRGLGGLT